MSAVHILIAILGLAALMIVHEAGHFFAARAFGMRVITFSIGFGPTFFKIEPKDGYFWFTSFGGKMRLRLRRHDPDKHGDTVYQAAMIPFLAYVQIAGMNPFEDNDPDDKGSYANASLLGRIVTIFGGPLANYLFASVFFFVSYFYGGKPVMPPPDERKTTIYVMPDTPADRAGMQDGDTIMMVDGKPVADWQGMAKIISKRPNRRIEIVVARDDKFMPLWITPRDQGGRGLIGVQLPEKRVPVTVAEAAKLSIIGPPLVVRNLVVAIGKAIRGKLKLDVGGPVKITSEIAKASKRGLANLMYLLGALSAYLGAFNLVPFPALDGGRLFFLGYELATRRRPDARVEAHIHVVGLLMLLGLMIYVTIFKDLGFGG